jgi:hypothetical protein
MQASIVEAGRHLEAVGLRLVVIDPQLGVFLRHNVSHALHRGERLILVEVDYRHRAVVPILLVEILVMALIPWTDISPAERWNGVDDSSRRDLPDAKAGCAMAASPVQ